ncbi:YtxH domain-containing protein [Haloarcula amylolytica]|nr:YtxH domain-containing protein [Haloarcula amylolytica]
MEIDYSTKSISCAVLAIGGAAVGGGPGFIVGGVLCAGSLLGCAINDAVRENTPCGAQNLEFYWNKTNSNHPLVVMIECTDISKDEREQTAEDFGEDMQDFADDAADVTVEVGQEAADEIDDLLDEGADEIDDIIDKGEGILLGEQDTVIKFPHHSTYVTRWFQKIH